MKYIVIDGEKVSGGEFEYNVGEVITLNSTIPIKCVRKEEVDGDLLQHFIKGRITFDFN